MAARVLRLAPMPLAATDITTERLLLRAPDESQAAAVADFYARNTRHFAPWDPPLPADHASPERVRLALADGREAFDAGRAHRWWLLPRDRPGRVVGSVHLSNLLRGPFQSCSLGYALDEALQGEGLMTEALQAVIAQAFGAGLNLHRLQAAVRPENARSMAVLHRLGFADEGLARDYLFIAGAWRDHRIFARINPRFVAPAHW